uniref:Uncharacterized protein n=1 Tax=Trichuris muris TaxID=70415 RepID=A0A5S6QMS0_TRIMR
MSYSAGKLVGANREDRTVGPAIMKMVPTQRVENATVAPRVFVKAEINGASLTMLVDTGACALLSFLLKKARDVYDWVASRREEDLAIFDHAIAEEISSMRSSRHCGKTEPVTQAEFDAAVVRTARNLEARFPNKRPAMNRVMSRLLANDSRARKRAMTLASFRVSNAFGDAVTYVPEREDGGSAESQPLVKTQPPRFVFLDEMDAPQLPPPLPPPPSDSRPSAAERPKRALRQPVWLRDYIIDN